MGNSSEEPEAEAPEVEAPEELTSTEWVDVSALEVQESTSPRVRAALVAQAQEPVVARPPSRFRDIKPSQLVNNSTMLKRGNWIWSFVSERLFRHVTFDERTCETIRDGAAEGTLVYAMNHRSMLDYLFFNYALNKHGLPLVFFGTRISLALYQPFWRMLVRAVSRVFGRRSMRLNGSEMLAYGLEREKPALIFLKRRAFWPWTTAKSSDALLNTLIAIQRERIHACAGDANRLPRPIIIIPQILVWTQEPDRYGQSTLKHLVFGNPAAPGRLRKFINFILNRRKAFVQLGKPINLVEFLDPQAAGTTVDVVGRKLRFSIMKAFRLEERVIKGPALKGARRMREEILRTRGMQTDLIQLARDTGKSRAQIERQMNRYLAEIAADFSMANIEFMCMALTLLFSRIYDEVVCDMEGLERIREAGRHGPLVLCPCHRSHVDYLVLSYLFYSHGLVPPHVAAGNNLNFFPLSYLFRRSGAFFMRRSFKGNPTYAIAFRDYLRKLIREGYWVEFFLEGGRSRTGKMLPPKFGILSRIIEAVKSGASPDVQFVPVYFGYEHVIEERSYTQELGGAVKQKETITSLLRTTKALWAKYDRLYVNFAEPISCRKLLEEAGQMGTPSDTPEHFEFIRRTAYRVLAGINDVASVTPSAVTAMVLLTHPRRGIRRDQLMGRVGFILEMASQKKASLSKTLKNALRLRRPEIAVAIAEMEEAGNRHLALGLGGQSALAKARGKAVSEVIDEVLNRFISKKQIMRHTFDDEVVYTPVPSGRINLDFYKNNIIQLYVKEAILAAAIRGNLEAGAAKLSVVRREASFLSKTLKYEFVYNPERSFEQQFQRTMAIFSESGLVELSGPDEDGETLVSIQEMGAETLMLCHRVLEPWTECYWMMTMAVDRELLQETAEKDFIKTVQKLTLRRYQEGDLSCPEAGSSAPLKNALQMLSEEKLVARRSAKRDRMLTLGEASTAEPERLARLASRLRRYFCV